MAIKKLLVGFTTVRNGKRTRFAAGKTVELTAEELELLEKLTKQTGTLHFRSPVNEVADRGVAAADVDYDGADVDLEDKTVAQLKAMLDFNGVTYTKTATKAELLELASDADGNDGDGDPDSGL